MELSHIGAQCSMSSCQQLDFLPFNCPWCKHKFCGDHQRVADHACPDFVDDNRILPQCPVCDQFISCLLTDDVNAKVSAHIAAGCPKESGRLGGAINTRCSMAGCKNTSKTPIVCGYCSHSFCMTHRHEGDHACTSLPSAADTRTIGPFRNVPKPQPRAEPLARLRDLYAGDEEAPAPMSIDALMTLDEMKARAVGPRSVPAADRLYLLVSVPEAQVLRPAFVSRKWNVGRALDVLTEHVAGDSSLRGLGLYNTQEQQLSAMTPVSQLSNGALVILQRGSSSSLVGDNRAAAGRVGVRA